MDTDKNRLKSFKYASAGLKHAFTTQVNFQIQLCVGLLVLVLAFWLNFNRYEWLILILTIGFVLTGELLNTVVEVVVDLAVKEKLLPEAKIAKDVSAGAVLLISIVSVVVGLILFLPHLLT
jgi:diacylglycerol kinase